jgi:DNA-binding beta-propeller fold protein YncE
VDVNNTVYVSASTSKLILVWRKGSNYSTNSISTNLAEPRSIFVTNNGEVYVGYTGNNRVDKCSVKNQSCDILMYAQGSCDGLFVDINNTIYCSISNHHQVVKTSLDRDLNIAVIVAGNGNAGLASNMLQYPNGIFVNINFNLYVADTLNHRIQLFEPEKLVGKTMAGNGAPETIELNLPMGIVLDADGYLFIVDQGNHRIIGSGPGGFRCIVGCFGGGSASSQLTHPMTMSFDSYGNLFVTDWVNSRVQKFLLATNSCSKYQIFYPKKFLNGSKISAFS